MSEWKEAPLGNLAETQLGKMLNQKKNAGEPRRYLGNDNVQWNSFKLDEVKEMRFKDSELDRFRLRHGDLLVCEGGDPGRCALWESDEEVYYQKALHRVRVGKELDARYLLYFLIHIGETQEIRQYYTGGATIKHLPAAALNRVVIRYPSYDTQGRIAGVLSAYDKLIENNRRQIKLLEEAAQRLYKEWFVDLRFPGHETTHIHNGIPEGWKRTTVGQSSSLVSRGVTPAYADDSNELVLGQRCVRNNLIDLSFARHHKPKKPNEKWLKKWDVLINSTGTGSLGRTAQFWLDSNNVVVDSHITIIRAQQREVAAYLGQWAFSNEAMLEALHTGSTGQTELPRDRVANCHVLIPDNDLLDLFYTLIEPMTMRIVAAQQQIVAAREARDRLLPKLMSGEIEV